MVDSGRRFASREGAQGWLLTLSRTNRAVITVRVVPSDDEANQ
jgi:hypothetical protein